MPPPSEGGIEKGGMNLMLPVEWGGSNDWIEEGWTEGGTEGWVECE